MAIALPSSKTEVSSLLVARISSIIFIYSGALGLNAFYIQSIGSGIGIYSGLFQVTIISQLLDVFLLFLSGFILMAWPIISVSLYNKVSEISALLTDVVSIYENLFEKEDFSDPSLYTKKINIIGIYIPRTEYCLVVLFSALGSSLLISSADLLSMYLSIELQSFGLYILTTIYRDYESSTASGLKYFLLGALSSCFILLGSGLIYSFTGLTNFESLYSLISSLTSPDIQNLTYLYWTITNIISAVNLGILFIFIGFLFKIAAAPLHSWSPDVYDETPTQVTMWLTVIPKISILILLLELQTGLSLSSLSLGDLTIYTNIINSLNIPSLTLDILNVSSNTSYVLTLLLLISSFLSLIIGTVLGLSQTRIKRLLAYSTISHLGFILLALAINTEQSIDSFIFYLLQYSITNLNLFLILLALGYLINKNGIKVHSNNILFFDFDIRYISILKGQLFSNPILSISLIVCLLSLSGIPPLLGFFSKQFVLLSAVHSGYWFMSFVAILTSVISASYYLRIVVLLVSDGDSSSPSKKNNSETLDISDFPDNLENTTSSENRSNNSIKAISPAVTSTNDELLLSNIHSFIISILTLFILLFIFKPTLILNSTQLLSLSLFNS